MIENGYRGFRVTSNFIDSVDKFNKLRHHLHNIIKCFCDSREVIYLFIVKASQHG